MKKVQITVREDLYELADKFAEEIGLKRSQLYNVALMSYINANRLTSALVDLCVSMRTLSDTIKQNGGKIDEESKKQLDDIEMLCKVLTESQLKK